MTTPIAEFTHELKRLFVKGKSLDKVFPETPRSFLVHQADGHVFKVQVHLLRTPLSPAVEAAVEAHPLASALVSDHSGLD